MTLTILKKDMKRKKTMNLILFLFITLCTVFLASSISNLIITSNGLDYFVTRSNTADYFITSSSSELKEWLEGQEYVYDFEANELIPIASENIGIRGADGEYREYEQGVGLNLSTLPNTFNLPLDRDNQPIRQISSGDILLSHLEASRNNIVVGDVMVLEVAGETYTFKVAYIVKDIIFGSSVGMLNCFYISQADFLNIQSSETELIYLYSIATSNISAFVGELNQQYFTSDFRFDQELLLNVYLIDLVVLAIFVIVGLCLIMISLVVLRFAIIFTLQEDYKEIGIMKAIGLEGRDIKKIYLIKYFFLAIMGAAVGFFLSFPFGNLLMRDIRQMIALPGAEDNIWIQLLCSVVIVLLVLAFCYSSSRKIDHYTAMQAIRSGETGERFNKKGILYLNKRNRLSTVCFLAFNDILSNLKSSVILLIVFFLSFALSILPLNITLSCLPFTQSIQKEVWLVGKN